jgi:hypothetical protein
VSKEEFKKITIAIKFIKFNNKLQMIKMTKVNLEVLFAKFPKESTLKLLFNSNKGSKLNIRHKGRMKAEQLH